MKQIFIRFILAQPFIISMLLIAAHFLRTGIMALTVIFLLTPLALFWRKPAVPKCLQIVLIICSIEWLTTLFKLTSIRMDMGAPWIRMAAILGGAALFTAASALAFQARAMKDWFSPSPADQDR